MPTLLYRNFIPHHYMGMKFPQNGLGMKFPQIIHWNCILFIILRPAYREGSAALWRGQCLAPPPSCCTRASRTAGGPWCQAIHWRFCRINEYA